MIRELKESDIVGLNSLPPLEWNFEYEVFLRDYLREEFFYAFVLMYNDRIVGTGNVLIKDKVGWLANIIIDINFRGKGLGLEMTKFLVDFLKDKKCETQLLIATKLGEKVYKKVGFKRLTEYQCFDSVIDRNYNYPKSIRALSKLDIQSVCALDKEANGENRIHLIQRYANIGFGYFNNDEKMLGFYLPDFGRGLVLSRDKHAGLELLKLKHSKKGKRTMLPNENKHGINVLIQLGLKKGDKCSRMILGKENKWNPQYIFSYGSGYCG